MACRPRVVVLVLAVLGIILGGGQGALAAGEGGFPFTFRDHWGRTVTVAAPPARIVTIGPGLTEILFAVGAGGRVVGVDAFSDYPPEVEELPKVGDLIQPSLDRLLALSPDLVLADDMAAGDLPRWERLALTVAVFAPTNLAEVMEVVALVGRAVGEPERGAAVAEEMARRLEAVAERVGDIPPEDRVRVFYEIWPDPPYTAGPGSFIHNLIELAGGINIAGGVGVPWIQYNLEALLAADPEVILTTREQHRDQLLRGGRPRWETLSAVRSGRVYVVDEDEVSRPGPRLADGLEAIARALYPQRFPPAGSLHP